MKAITLGIWLLVPVSAAWAADPQLVGQAREGLRKTVTFLSEEVAYEGGYLGSYLADLSQGYGKLGDERGRTWNWIQSPGSPAMGFAFLHAREATGNAFYLDAAVQVARSLVRGQLQSGGWDDNVDHSPQGERTYFYRRNQGSSDPRLTSGRNRSTFDDNISQNATRLLMAVDQALEQQDQEISDAVRAALALFVEAQDHTGGWPQNYPLAGRGYGDFYTYNDNAIRDCIDVMMRAYRTYSDRRYYDSVVKGGEFILKTQLPEPHPVWAQQYDSDLQPAWARRMEPPAACAGESAGILRLLPEIAIFTDDTRFLKPIPPALAWYQRSRLEDGLWARYYELKTNRPLYQISRNRTAYWLSYEDHDTPDHYSFKGAYGRGLDAVQRAYDAIMASGPRQYERQRQPREPSEAERIQRARRMESQVREVLEQQDDQGRWVEKRGGREMIFMATFQRNMRVLSDYLRLVDHRSDRDPADQTPPADAADAADELPLLGEPHRTESAAEIIELELPAEFTTADRLDLRWTFFLTARGRSEPGDRYAMWLNDVLIYHNQMAPPRWMPEVRHFAHSLIA